MVFESQLINRARGQCRSTKRTSQKPLETWTRYSGRFLWAVGEHSVAHPLSVSERVSEQTELQAMLVAAPLASSLNLAQVLLQTHQKPTLLLLAHPC